MAMTALMIQGTGSNVGKSLLVAGLCRAGAAARTVGGAVQAAEHVEQRRRDCRWRRDRPGAGAAGTGRRGSIRVTDMNPVLLKPETDTGAQVVVQGRRLTTVRARDYAALKPRLMAPVLESFARLKATHDLVIVEGAGSPAEVNLRAGDIANMGFASRGGVPVVLVGDIDRGGVIAQIVGTQGGAGSRRCRDDRGLRDQQVSAATRRFSTMATG